MTSFNIKNRPIGIDNPPFVIAEMSGNHNNSFEQALGIVHAAAKTGADAVKLQTYTADTITINAESDDFVISNPDSLWTRRTLYDLYDEASTDWEWIKQIMAEAEKLDLICFSSVFDETSVDFMEDLNAGAYKIASFENNHLPLIRKAASTGKPIIISTGTASEDEIHEAVEAARNGGCMQLALLKCTSDYPADPAASNLMTIPHMKETFECEVGLSDHTLGIGVPVASVALGATIIEKHFITDRNLGGVDAAFSADISEMSQLVAEATNAWKALGSVSFDLSENEQRNTQFKRSIYAVASIKAGEPFSPENIRVIRPGYGLHPRYYDAHRNFVFGEPVDLPEK
jgi:pseudaminic acid synthase